MADDSTPAAAVAVPLDAPVVALVPCPLCGGDAGWTLTPGDTYRWWNVLCRHCGGAVAECRSDRRTNAGTMLPLKWDAADKAWNEAGHHAQTLRDALAAALAALDAATPVMFRAARADEYAAHCDAATAARLALRHNKQLSGAKGVRLSARLGHAATTTRGTNHEKTASA